MKFQASVLALFLLMPAGIEAFLPVLTADASAIVSSSPRNDCRDLRLNVAAPDNVPSLSQVDDFVASARLQYQETAKLLEQSAHKLDSMQLSDQLHSSQAQASEALHKTMESAKASILAHTNFESPAIPPGKAPSMAQYLVHNGGSDLSAAPMSATELWANAQSKFSLMVDNSMHFMQSRPPMEYEGIPTIPAGNSISWHEITQTLVASTTWEVSGGWIAAGCAVLAASNQKQAGFVAKQYQLQRKYDRHAKKVLELASNMESMSSEIQSLNSEAASLKVDLASTQRKLERQDAELQRERRRMAERLQFVRSHMERVKARAERSDAKVAELKALISSEERMAMDYKLELTQITNQVKAHIEALERRAVDDRSEETVPTPQPPRFAPPVMVNGQNNYNNGIQQQKQQSNEPIPHFAYAK